MSLTLDQLINTPIEQKLLDAQHKAAILFKEVEYRNIIAIRRSEKEINTNIFNLAFELFGIKKYWHKRIVRAGKNTLHPYKENPPNLTVRENDIVFLDFGPVFEDWEADFGRTYVVGNDASMLKIQADIMSAFDEGKAYFNSHSEITAAELYFYIQSLSKKYGWGLGGRHCGHLIGQFPHEKIEDHDIISYIHPKNNRKLRDTDSNGKVCHWILEVHFIDNEKEIGGFTEELLTL
jgi:Xaa-Pro dipeptidase